VREKKDASEKWQVNELVFDASLPTPHWRSIRVNTQQRGE